MATVAVKYDDAVKKFTNAEATEEGATLMVRRNGAVVGRFDINRVERWSATVMSPK
jgi:hypothetical protein